MFFCFLCTVVSSKNISFDSICSFYLSAYSRKSHLLHRTQSFTPPNRRLNVLKITERYYFIFSLALLIKYITWNIVTDFGCDVIVPSSEKKTFLNCFICSRCKAHQCTQSILFNSVRRMCKWSWFNWSKHKIRSSYLLIYFTILLFYHFIL